MQKPAVKETVNGNARLLYFQGIMSSAHACDVNVPRGSERAA